MGKQMKNKTPLQNIRAKCIDCTGTSRAVKHCVFTACPLHPLRFGRHVPSGTSRLKAIRRYCVSWCMNNQPKEVRLCPSTECPLYPFRVGSNIYRKQTKVTESAAERAPECKKVASDRGFFERKATANGSVHCQNVALKNVYQATVQHSSTT